LHDYLIGKLEHRRLREAVTVSLEGVVEVAQWSDWSDRMGYGVYPEVVYAPVDNIDVSLGALFVGAGVTRCSAVSTIWTSCPFG
jgi:hypothetical protein